MEAERIFPIIFQLHCFELVIVSQYDSDRFLIYEWGHFITQHNPYICNTKHLRDMVVALSYKSENWLIGV